MYKERTCPKCNKIHNGEGLSPSVRNKLKICGNCYKRYEKFRHIKANIAKLRVQYLKLQKEKPDAEFERNLAYYQLQCNRRDNLQTTRVIDYFDKLYIERAINFANGKPSHKPLDPFPELPNYLSHR